MGAIQTIRAVATNFDELSAIIANPPADRPIAGAIGTGGQALCNAYGNLNLGQQLLTGPARPIIDLLCKPYFDGGGFDPPVETLPFSGGQCPTTYSVLSQYRDASTSNNFQGLGPTNVLGPITGMVARPAAGGGAGRRDLFITSGTAGNDVQVATDVFDQGLGFNIVSLTRVDGQPDNCGDPPSDFTPGANPPPPNAPFPPGEEPGVNPEGQPFFFVPDLQPPGSDPIPLDDEPLGDAPAAPAPPAGGDGLPGDPDAVGSEAGEVTGGDDGQEIDFGEPPENKIWVGCVVETVTDTRIGNIPGTGPQSTVWPSVRGNVALRYGSLYGRSERINSRFFDIFRPNSSLVVTGCFLQAQEGSTCKVFPISAITCPVNPCES